MILLLFCAFEPSTIPLGWERGKEKWELLSELRGFVFASVVLEICFLVPEVSLFWKSQNGGGGGSKETTVWCGRLGAARTHLLLMVEGHCPLCQDKAPTQVGSGKKALGTQPYQHFLLWLLDVSDAQRKKTLSHFGFGWTSIKHLIQVFKIEVSSEDGTYFSFYQICCLLCINTKAP